MQHELDDQGKENNGQGVAVGEPVEEVQDAPQRLGDGPEKLIREERLLGRSGHGVIATRLKGMAA